MPTANINNSNCAVDLHLSSGGERTRTADFHVAKVDPADFGGLLRLIAAGQNVIHTLTNYLAQWRPRDRRAIELVSHMPRLRVASALRVASRRWRATRGTKCVSRPLFCGSRRICLTRFANHFAPKS